MPVAAADGRDFAGHYDLTRITEKGSQVELTLSLRLFNYSGADLKQVVVSVRPAPPAPGVLATFAPVKLWRSGADVTISQQLTVPREQFQRWSGRSQPPIFVGYTDANGHSSQHFAQVSRNPLISMSHPADAE